MTIVVFVAIILTTAAAFITITFVSVTVVDLRKTWADDLIVTIIVAIAIIIVIIAVVVAVVVALVDLLVDVLDISRQRKSPAKRGLAERRK